VTGGFFEQMKIDNDIRRLRRKKIKGALVRSGGSVRHAAAALGWSRQTVYYWIKQLELQRFVRATRWKCGHKQGYL